MRWTGFLLCCLSLHAADIARLHDLEFRDRIFDLRTAIGPAPGDDSETLFYRALLAGRFGHEESAIEDLHRFLATRPSPELERKANEELASALVRIGRYGEASAAWTEALRLTPEADEDRGGNENARDLFAALRDVPPQSVEFGDGGPVRATGSHGIQWNVPVEVGGHPAVWIFDTGASISTLSESEAKRLGLTIRDSSAYINGSTAKKNPLRLAVAPELSFGPARLRNVVFLVLRDQALYVAPVKYQINGILGLPVIRAMGRVRMPVKGTITIEPGAPLPPGEPNMFYDRLAPYVEVRHGQRTGQMFLDTGANRSAVYASFREALGLGESARLKTGHEKSAGVGGIVQQTVARIPKLDLEVLGKPVELRKISLLPQPPGDGRWFDGVLGIDAMPRGFTLDFRAMQFSPE
jgi:hypothetical protein